ncbi:MAG: hypothetical protein ACLUI5_14295 [Fusicatenibacter saccharivorans]
MDDWSSFRTTTSEQQRLRAALSSFCESQDLPEEQRAAYTAYLRKRIRPAVEMLIREDDFSKLERILQTGWLSDADRKRFLNLAADQQKWQAFRILLNRSSQDPMQENTESRKTEAAVQKEKSTKEKEALALRLFEEARKNLCWLYPELGEAILFFRHQPSDRTKAITSDGHTIYFNSDFVLRMCAENSSFLKEGYQHLLLECIRRFGKETPEPEKEEQSPVSWLMPEKEKSLRFHGWCREKSRNLSSLFNQSGNVLPASWRKTTAPAACGEARTAVEKKKLCPGSKKERTITAAF